MTSSVESMPRMVTMLMRERSASALESKWSAALELLATTPAVTSKGMIAKASALMNHAVEEDIDRHRDIATSLALDVLRHFGV